MKFESCLQHALTVMVDLEVNKDSGLLRAADIAERNRLPARLITLMVYKLKAAGLIKLNPGVKGSYELARPLDKIKLKDVFRAVGETYKFKTKIKAINEPTSVMKDFFSTVLEELRGTLDHFTLEDVLQSYRSKNVN